MSTIAATSRPTASVLLAVRKPRVLTADAAATAAASARLRTTSEPAARSNSDSRRGRMPIVAHGSWNTNMNANSTPFAPAASASIRLAAIASAHQASAAPARSPAARQPRRRPARSHRRMRQIHLPNVPCSRVAGSTPK